MDHRQSSELSESRNHSFPNPSAIQNHEYRAIGRQSEKDDSGEIMNCFHRFEHKLLFLINA